MLEGGKISTRQNAFLIFCLFTIPITLSSPQILINWLKQDVWEAMLLAYFLDASLAVVFYILGLRYPQQTMVEYSETILGPWMGKLVGLLFVLFYAGVTVLILNTISDILNIILMPETPPGIFSLTILLVSTYAVNAGLEVIARLSEIVGPLIIISLILVNLLNINNTHLVNLLPVFQHAPIEIMQASLLPAGLFGMCISMGMFMAYQNVPRNALKAKWIAITIGVILAIMSFLQMIAVLGVNIASNQLYPMYRLAQMIQTGDIFERLESIILVFWIAGGFITISILYWNTTLGLAQIFKLKRYQTITPYIGGVILIFSLIGFQPITNKPIFFKDIFPFIAIFVEDFLMILLLIVSFLRHGKFKQEKRKVKR